MSANVEKEILIRLSHKYNSFYLYEEKTVLNQIKTLKESFKGVDFLYSMKANPNSYILDTVMAAGFGIDAASSSEVLTARAEGFSEKKILYSTPGKSDKEIEAVLNKCILIADSINEITCIQKVAEHNNVKAEIGIRINPDFTFYSESGQTSKFGIDEEQLFKKIPEFKMMKNIEIVGLHVHSHSQELDAMIIEQYYEKMFRLSERFQKALDTELKFINFGSGMGITYSHDDKPLDVDYLGDAFYNLMLKYKGCFKRTKLYIETGRFVAGKSGLFVTKVMDRKLSHGKIYVILDNTLNGFIRPCYEEMLLAYMPGRADIESYEPMFTTRKAFDMEVVSASTDSETAILTGNLCTSADVVKTDYEGKKLFPGDLVIFKNAGSYAASITPMQFASHIPPAELFLTKEGTVKNAASK